jgi:Rieske Fe-S protein
MMNNDQSRRAVDGVSRRAFVSGLSAAAATVVAGCSRYAPKRPAPQAQPAGASSAGTGRQAGIAKTTDIPVGGGVILGDHNVVITQPTAGNFKAFSATCTHQGCRVASVSDGTINCNCHGSKFNITDGSVANPPAPSPLPPVTITVESGEISVT